MYRRCRSALRTQGSPAPGPHSRAGDSAQAADMTADERQPADHAVLTTVHQRTGPIVLFLEAGAGSGKTSVDRRPSRQPGPERPPVARDRGDHLHGEGGRRVAREDRRRACGNRACATRYVMSTPRRFRRSTGLLRDCSEIAPSMPASIRISACSISSRLTCVSRSRGGRGSGAATRRGRPCSKRLIWACSCRTCSSPPSSCPAIGTSPPTMPTRRSSEDQPEDQSDRDRALAEVTIALRHFIADDAARRRREGVLTYDDLLLEARDLLVQSGKTRRDLRARYQAILIDEFQDTDPLTSPDCTVVGRRS